MNRGHCHELTRGPSGTVRRLIAVVDVVCFLGLAAARAGVTVTPIHIFNATAPYGTTPYTQLVQGTNGNLYGVANSGGAYGLGALFQITPSGTLTSLYSFTGSNDGALPRGALAQCANGNFFGTAEDGGSNNYGTIFEISPAGVLTPLYSFAGYPHDGAGPDAALVQATDGNFYGTTMSGGYYDAGTVFQMTPAGVVSNIYMFKGKNDGSGPFAPLVQGMDGQLYGTTIAGGDTSLNDNAGFGAIFKITTNGVLTPLYAFTDEDDGENPYSALAQGVDGNFYGTAIHGTTGFGAIFQITPQGGFTVLHNFVGTDGSGPIGTLVQATDTNFYGTTLGGGSDRDGTVFQITTNGDFTSLYSFTNGADGAEPFAGLIQGTNGDLYGTTIGSQLSLPHGEGSVFQITTQGALTTLFTFPGGSDGAMPHAALIVGTNGNLYGTTINGGTNGEGTAFEITLDGDFTLLHSFTGLADGARPNAPLLQATDGDFYGTDGNDYLLMAPSNAAAYGTVFKITPAGALTVLDTFTNGSDGSSSHSGLVQGLDGNFYGTSENGGANGQGAIFKISPEGVLTNLYSFTGGSDGANPQAGLVQANDTNFYGTASAGGAGYGTVFRISPESAFILIHEFGSANGDTSGPLTPLALGTDGNLYGCTSGESSGSFATIFKVTPPNTYSLLYTFANGSYGQDLIGGLVQGSNGVLYGTASTGGPNGTGTVFKVTMGGLLQPVYAFSALDVNGYNQEGANPFAALVQAGDGNFYGTTGNGGTYGSGTIFRLTITPTPPPTFLSATEIDGAMLLSWSTEYGALYQLQYATNLNQSIWSNIGGPISATNSTLGLETDSNPADPQRFYRVVLLP